MSKRHAFLLACESYAHPESFRNLSYAKADLVLLQETLTEWCDYDAANIHVEAPEPGAAIAPAHVLNALRLFVERTEPGDTLLFFFAGHGHKKDNKSYVALPNSTKENISETGVELAAVTNALRLADRFCVRIFDCCHSGADTRSDDAGDEEFAKDVSQESGSEGEYITLASCRPEQKSYEDQSLSHGLYTYCLCEAIKALPQGSAVEAESLHKAVQRRVGEIARGKGWNQQPIKNSRTGETDVFAVRVARPTVFVPASPDRGNALRERYEAALGAESRLVKNRTKELADSASTAKASFLEEIARLTDYALEPKVVLTSADQMPEDWKRYVVDHVQSLNVNSLHRLTSYTPVDGDPMEMFRPLRNRAKPKTYIASSIGMPESFVRLTWKSNDLVPTGEAVCYIIPLETKTYVIAGACVDSAVSTETSKVITFKNYVELDADWATTLRKPIIDAISACSKRIETSIQSRLDYRDRERSLGNPS